MSRRGYVLIELLVASSLLSIVASGFYSGFSQSMKMRKSIQETSAMYGPIKILWMRVEKDLRATVPLHKYLFLGDEDEMTFASAGAGAELWKIHYFVKDGTLFRSEQALPEKFISEAPTQRSVMRKVESVRFEYAYLGEDEKLVFLSEWAEKPYFGIPRAVKVEIKPLGSKKVFSKLVSIPQGRWGHLASEEVQSHE